MSESTEAPASASVKIKSPNGFEYIFTMRDDSVSTLMKKIDTMEALWKDGNWEPLAQNAPRFAKKEPEYVEGRVCPTCSNKLIYAFKKDGTKFIKCSTNKYINGQATGCPFVDWGDKPRVPERQVSEEDYGL